mmetsp:Transcript_5105/g.19122  ORF Transcript_5105/g.19122 Transcript_5105/m.19122 type:complete len:216 (+) Transcript_5105:439-1086(+)
MSSAAAADRCCHHLHSSKTGSACSSFGHTMCCRPATPAARRGGYSRMAISPERPWQLAATQGGGARPWSSAPQDPAARAVCPLQRQAGGCPGIAARGRGSVHSPPGQRNGPPERPFCPKPPASPTDPLRARRRPRRLPQALRAPAGERGRGPRADRRSARRATLPMGLLQLLQHTPQTPHRPRPKVRRKTPRPPPQLGRTSPPMREPHLHNRRWS